MHRHTYIYVWQYLPETGSNGLRQSGVSWPRPNIAAACSRSHWCSNSWRGVLLTFPCACVCVCEWVCCVHYFLMSSDAHVSPVRVQARMCACGCVCVFVHVYVCICMCMCACVRVFMCVWECGYVCVRESAHAYVCVCTSKCVSVSGVDERALTHRQTRTNAHTPPQEKRQQTSLTHTYTHAHTSAGMEGWEAGREDRSLLSRE